MQQYLPSLFGGILIGLAVSLMLFLNGRVTGVSGIINGALKPQTNDWFWRISFILGLLAGGVAINYFVLSAFVDQSNRGFVTTLMAGLLVGFGTVMAGGCTSGHGICGISRFSIRSVAATVIFMLCGVLSATLFRIIFGQAL